MQLGPLTVVGRSDLDTKVIYRPTRTVARCVEHQFEGRIIHREVGVTGAQLGWLRPQ